MTTPDPMTDERLEQIRQMVDAGWTSNTIARELLTEVRRLQIRLVDQEHELISARTARGETQERYSRNLAEHHAFMNDMLDALDLTIDEDGEYILDQIVTAARATRAELAEQRERADGMASCVEEMGRLQLWFSRGQKSLTVRDALRTWADAYRATGPAKG